MPVTPSSLLHIHEKICGQPFSGAALKQIVTEINNGLYSASQIAAFLTASAAHPLSRDEVLFLTKAMVSAGPSLHWDEGLILDKHCIGGLPGNRTTPIIVAVLAALGFKIPKTSSRAITSAAGTADVMEVLAPVDLSMKQMRDVINSEGGCVVWGGAVGLSPVDDDLVRIAREIGVDSEGQLVSSILSKKLAAGSTHVVIDIPVGPTAKIKTHEKASALKEIICDVAKALNMTTIVEITDGSQPIGWGIGPALEARDVIAVLQNSDTAPVDLRDKAMLLTGKVLELVKFTKEGEGVKMAFSCLSSGKAWKKFKAICEAQGGLKEIPRASWVQNVNAKSTGVVSGMNNHLLSRLAMLAGAPEDKVAGVELFTELGTYISKGQSLFALHSSSQQRLQRALTALEDMCPVKITDDLQHRSHVA